MNRMFRRATGRGLIAGAALAALLTSAPCPARAQSSAGSAPPSQPAQNPPVPAGVKVVPQMPAAGPARPFRFPAVATQTLENGLRVFVVSDHRLPSLTVALVIPQAGALEDPSGLPGVAQMTAGLLTEGTATRTTEQIAQSIDLVGGSISAHAGHDDTTAIVRVAKKDFALGMDLLSDVVLHPSFPAQQLELGRQRVLSTLHVDYANPAYIATAAFSRMVYAGNPYGLPSEGTPDSISRISRDDVTGFYHAHYGPKGALLAFSGDITPEEAFAAAKKYFGAWSPAATSAASPAPPAAPKGLHLFVINQPGTAQSQIRVGRPGIARNDPDYIPLLVANRIFGGGYNSLLNTAVRIQKGLTYGANSVFLTQRLAGSFIAATSTRTDKTVAAVQLIVDLIGRMASGQIDQSHLNFARDYLAGVYPVQTETPDQVLTRVITVAEYGLPSDYNQSYPQKIAAVTLDQVKQMASRYFDAKNLDLLIVGNAAAFRDDLKKAFPSASYEEISLNQLDLLQPKLHEVAVIPPPTPATLAQGRAAILAAAQAAGGPALTAVKSLHVVETSRIIARQGSINVEETYQLAYPDRIHSELNVMGQPLVQVYDGKQGWMASAQSVESLPANIVGNLRRRILLTEGIGVYQAALAGMGQAQWLGTEQVENHNFVAVEWKTDAAPVKLYVDPATKLIFGARYTASTTAGSVETVEIWSDFRSVAGVNLPFHVAAYQNGKEFMDVTIKDIQLNGAVDPKSFAKPQRVSVQAPAPSAAPAPPASAVPAPAPAPKPAPSPTPHP